MAILNMWYFIAIYLACMNVLGFATMGIDKRKAIKGKWRISESALLVIAAIGGIFGVMMGMRVWHHKTQKRKFTWGLPLLLAIQVLLLYYGFSQFGLTQFGG